MPAAPNPEPEPRGGLFIISAPSGAGKTSLTRAAVPRLAALGIRAEISVSYTTRAPRPGEQDGVHYHFIDETRFVSMIEAGEFLEHAHVFGRRYGTGRGRTEALLTEGCDVILDIDWQGGRQVRTLAPDALGVFILPPSLAELERRLRGRGQDDESMIRGRMAEAQTEAAHYAEYDCLIVNRDFDVALNELIALFVARRLRRESQALRHTALLSDLLAPVRP